MKRIITLITVLTIQALILVSCGSTTSVSLTNSKAKSIDDTKYGFVQYLKDKDGTIRYAVDKDNDLYSYSINNDDKGNKELVCGVLVESTGGIKQSSLGSSDFILTNSGILYGKGYLSDFSADKNLKDWKFKKLMEGVSEFRVDGDNNNICNILALKDNGDLYGWGENRKGEVGNGTTSYNNPSNEVRKPFKIMNGIKNFDIAHNNTRFYTCAGLTANNELYVWGYFKNETNLPIKVMDDVQSFTLRTEDLLAITNKGEVLVNQDKIHNMSANASSLNTTSKNSYFNELQRNNQWEPAFNSSMVSLDAKYFNNSIDEIHGQIKNYTNQNWTYVEITFALYDENDKQVGNAYSKIVKTIRPNEVASFKSEGGDLYYLKAKKYKLVSISPMSI